MKWIKNTISNKIAAQINPAFVSFIVVIVVALF